MRNNRADVLLAVTTRMGWKVYGDRLSGEARKRQDNAVRFVPFTPWAWARRVYWQTGYSDNTPSHLGVFDPFTVLALQATCTRALWGDYSAAIVATQGVAAGLMRCRPTLPIFLIVDATRQLYRDEFAAHHISDEDIDREASLFKHCAHIFSLSRWAAASVVATSGIGAQKVTVLPPPSFGPEISIATRCGPTDTNKRLKLLFIGLDFKRKGGPLLLQWQRELLHNYVDLYIVTEPSNIDSSVPNTTWLGAVANDALIKNVMTDMDILIHPTQRDCSSIVVVEAAMCGVPSIVSAIGGIKDLVENGFTGFAIEPDKPEHFIKAILFFYRDRNALRQFGINARLKAEREFCVGSVYDRMMRIVLAEAS